MSVLKEISFMFNRSIPDEFRADDIPLPIIS